MINIKMFLLTLNSWKYWMLNPYDNLKTYGKYSWSYWAVYDRSDYFCNFWHIVNQGMFDMIHECYDD